VIAADPAFHVERRLEPGEVSSLENNTVLHARSRFEDFEDPTRKRHLRRLWLSAHGAWGVSDARLQQGIPVKQGVASDADAIAGAARQEAGPGRGPGAATARNVRP